MPRTPPQIYVGRKVCDGPCGRWLHDVDFKPRWKKFKKKPRGDRRRSHNLIKTERIKEDGKVIWVKGPYYDNLCARCRSQRSMSQIKAKLEAMTPAEKRRWMNYRNEMERNRVNGRHERTDNLERRLRVQIANAKAVIGQTRATYNGDELMPLMPFRLYLLRLIKSGWTMQAIATQTHRDEAEVRRWAEGIYWEGPCNPQPLHSVSLGTIDQVLVGMNESPDKLNELYPWEEK